MAATEKKLLRMKGRKESGGFFSIPHTVLSSLAYTSLSAKSTKLLLDIGFQFRGINNGALVITWDVMRRRGWKSKETLERAQAELEDRGLIKKTRQGGRNWPNYWALTFRPVNECDGSLEVRPTHTASNEWRKRQPN